MTDGELLLRAILTDPADDTVRLVYADHLDEAAGQHTERAQYIRSEVGVSRAGGWCLCSVDVAANLSHGLARPWMLAEIEGLPEPRPSEVEYRRGFIESVTCTAADFVRHAGGLFAAHPITRVTSPTASRTCSAWATVCRACGTGKTPEFR